MELQRVYICYFLTTFLLSIFVYTLVSTNLQNIKKIERLREEVDDIAHTILQTTYQGKAEPTDLTNLIDSFVKKRLAGIWDDLYAIKKQIKSTDCSTGPAKNQKMETQMAEERVNYASEKLGAKIVDVKAEPICKTFFSELFGRNFFTNLPVYMLQPSMEPGSCFGFRDNKADVTIKLPQEILLDQVSIQHITKKQSPTEDTSSAPKDFQIFGLKNNREFHLGSFTFENNQPLQYFNTQNIERFQFLRIKFETNHGHPKYTCVYRIAVYGKL